MYFRHLPQAIVVVTFGALACAAGAQTSNNAEPQHAAKMGQSRDSMGQPPGTTQQPSAKMNPSSEARPHSSDMTSQSSDKMTGHRMTRHRNMTDKSARSTLSSSTLSSNDAAYQAALKNCVKGDSSQREGCIDQAIARYGHS